MQEEYQAKKLAALPPLKKDFYEEDPEVANMSIDEVDVYRYDVILLVVFSLISLLQFSKKGFKFPGCRAIIFKCNMFLRTPGGNLSPIL